MYSVQDFATGGNIVECFANFLINVNEKLKVRQAAAYGCGVMGQFGGPGFAQWCKEAIPRLVQVIQAPNSREQENVNPTENAISAVTKILKWNQGAINVDEILPVW